MLHSARAVRAGAERRIPAQAFHLLAAGSWDSAHRLIVGQLVPRVLLSGDGAAQNDLRLVLDAMVARSNEVRPPAPGVRAWPLVLTRAGTGGRPWNPGPRLPCLLHQIDGWADGGSLVLSYLELMRRVQELSTNVDGMARLDALRAQARPLERAALGLLRGISDWRSSPKRAMLPGGAATCPGFRSHAGLGGHAPWPGEAPCREVGARRCPPPRARRAHCLTPGGARADDGHQACRRDCGDAPRPPCR